MLIFRGGRFWILGSLRKFFFVRKVWRILKLKIPAPHKWVKKLLSWEIKLLERNGCFFNPDFLFRKHVFFSLFFLWFPSQNQEEIRLRKLQLFHRKPTPCWISWPLNQEATPRKQKTPILPNICDWSNLLLNICHEISTLLLGGGFKFFFHHYLVNRSNLMKKNQTVTSHTFGNFFPHFFSILLFWIWSCSVLVPQPKRERNWRVEKVEKVVQLDQY